MSLGKNIIEKSSSHRIQLQSLDILIILGENLLRYLDRWSDLLELSRTCKYFRTYIFSAKSEIWRILPVNICLDLKCFGCGREKIGSGLSRSIISNCLNISHLQLHIPSAIMPSFLRSLNNMKSLEKLHLRVRDESTTAPRHKKTIAEHKDSIWKTSEINELIVYSPQSASALIVDLLLVVGRNLTRLHLHESSPENIFSILEQNCPNLNYLIVDGKQKNLDLAMYKCDSLLELRVCNSSIVLDGHLLQLSSLRAFELIDSLEIYTKYR